MAQETQEDVVALLLEQHETVRNLLIAVERDTGDARREAFQPLVRLLAVHETAEEMVIYPAIRSAGDEGKRVADARIEEEDQSKKELTELEKLDLNSAEFESRFKAFRTAVESHAENEEREVFPLLEKTTDETLRRRMAAALTVAQGIAPTHPHKVAPKSAVGNLLVGPFVSMVDRARDAIGDVIR